MFFQGPLPPFDLVSSRSSVGARLPIFAFFPTVNPSLFLLFVLVDLRRPSGPFFYHSLLPAFCLKISKIPFLGRCIFSPPRFFPPPPMLLIKTGPTGVWDFSPFVFCLVSCFMFPFSSYSSFPSVDPPPSLPLFLWDSLSPPEKTPIFFHRVVPEVQVDECLS